MTVHAPFNPRRGANQVLSATSTSAEATIDPQAKSVRVVNAGSTNIVHIRIGQTPQTATSADLPVMPGQAIVVSKEQGEGALAYYSASGTAIHVQTGEGGFC